MCGVKQQLGAWASLVLSHRGQGGSGGETEMILWFSLLALLLNVFSSAVLGTHCDILSEGDPVYSHPETFGRIQLPLRGDYAGRLDVSQDHTAAA